MTKEEIIKKLHTSTKGTREMNANEPVAYVDNVWINRPDLAIAIAVGLKKHFGVKE